MRVLKHTEHSDQPHIHPDTGSAYLAICAVSRGRICAVMGGVESELRGESANR